MSYEFWAILKDGTEHSIVGEDLEQVKKDGASWLAEHYDDFYSSTIYLPHENAEWAKKLSRDRFLEKQKKRKAK